MQTVLPDVVNPLFLWFFLKSTSSDLSVEKNVWVPLMRHDVYEAHVQNMSVSESEAGLLCPCSQSIRGVDISLSIGCRVATNSLLAQPSRPVC